MVRLCLLIVHTCTCTHTTHTGCCFPLFLGSEIRVETVSGWIHQRGCGVGGEGRGAEEIGVPSSDPTPAAKVVMENLSNYSCIFSR